jgi:hypothetical protein
MRSASRGGDWLVCEVPEHLKLKPYVLVLKIVLNTTQNYFCYFELWMNEGRQPIHLHLNQNHQFILYLTTMISLYLEIH